MPFIDDDHSKGWGRNIQILISIKVSSTKSLLDFTGHQKYSTQYRSESQSQVPAEQQNSPDKCCITHALQCTAARLTLCFDSICNMNPK